MSSRRRLKGLALILALIAPLVLAACQKPPIGYRQNGRLVETDPATGDTVITQYWMYDNGASAVTFKRIPKGNTDGRGEPPPPEARFAD